MIGVGLMCGTSLDGIDVALVDIAPPARFGVDLLAFETVPFAPPLRARLLAAMPPSPCTALDIAALHAEIGDAFGAAAARVSNGRAQFAGSHGVTIAHDGDARRTLQIGDAFRIREALGCTVCFDFRSADTAAGGAGAPLVPFLDAALFADATEHRVALNLGGIANITVLAAGGAPADGVAFDTGPANMVLDAYAERRSGGAERCDRDGARARHGTIDERVLGPMLADPYFTQPAPKTTGRERFGAPFLARHGDMLDALEFDDAMATLAALTVRTVADAIRAAAPTTQRVIVSGGGANNPALLDGLRAALTGIAVERSDRRGIDADAKEAIAFAVLAERLLRGEPAGLPRVTGARGPRLLGAIAPLGLDALLAALRAEESADE